MARELDQNAPAARAIWPYSKTKLLKFIDREAPHPLSPSAQGDASATVEAKYALFSLIDGMSSFTNF